MKETVSDRLNLYITRNPNTNQRRLAQALKVHPTVINQWFTGRVEPSPRLLFKTIELFPDIDANWLIRGNTDKKKGFTIFAKPFKTTANMLYLRFTG